MTEKIQVVTDRAPSPAGPYSQGIIADKFVFVAGQRPANPKTGEIVEGGIQEINGPIHISNVKKVG